MCGAKKYTLVVAFQPILHFLWLSGVLGTEDQPKPAPVISRPPIRGSREGCPSGVRPTGSHDTPSRETSMGETEVLVLATEGSPHTPFSSPTTIEAPW